MVNDHLSDLISRIRNGYRAGKRVLQANLTRPSLQVAKILVEEGYLEKIEESEGKLILSLKYNGKKPALMGIRRVSKPGARIYRGARELPRVFGALGKNILTTPKGIMIDKKARKENVGGEIIAQVW